MAGIQKLIIVGRLGKSPEVRHLDNGNTVANFSVAVSESYKNKSGEKVEQTEWFACVCWKGLAEIAEKYLSVGDQVYIEAKLRTRSYESNGQKKFITEAVVDVLQMLGGKKQNTPVTESSGDRGDKMPWE